jgi:hypothetical protein
MKKLVYVVLAASLPLAACGGGSGSSSGGSRQQLSITAKDFSLKVDNGATLRPGAVDITALSRGKSAHGLLIGRINDGVKAGDVTSLIAKDPTKALTMFSLAGGINALPTGGGAWKATTTVRSGTYIVVDTGAGKDGKANFTKPGEVTTFTVSGSARAAAAAASDAQVDLQDYAIDMPDKIASHASLRVRNTGQDDHELTFVSVHNAKVGAAFVKLIRSGKQVQFQSTPVPVLAPTGPGTDTTIHIDLPPGRYLAYCSFGSVRSKGKPHATLGMIHQVTVTK